MDERKKPATAAPAGAADAGAASSSDVVLVHGRTEDKKGLRVLRARNEQLEIGEVRPIEEGKPLQGDIVRLKPRPGLPLVCDVETEFKAPAPPTGARHPGPARVATAAYRQNWDTIWNRPSEKRELN